MNGLTSIDTLRQLMQPPAHPIDANDSWSKAEADLGTALPSDYKEFIGVYGTGMIEGMPVYVFNALSDLKASGEAIFNAYRLLVEGGYELAHPLFPASGGLLPWGATGNGDYLHWKTLGQPDCWPIVVWDCSETEFTVLDHLNFSGFLVELLSNRLTLPTFPMEFFESPPRFVQGHGRSLESSGG